MAADENNGTRVSFTVKELLANMNVKLDALILAVADKIGRTEFEALKLIVQSLEKEQANSRAVSIDRRWLAGIILALISALAALGWLIHG